MCVSVCRHNNPAENPERERVTFQLWRTWWRGDLYMAVEETARAATRRAIRPTTVEVAPEEQVAHETVPAVT